MENNLTEIEKYIIQRVKEIRKANNLTQEQLSLKLDKGVGFIGDIELSSKNAKYNIKHLNKIAKISNCSPRDFWHEKAL